MCTNEFKSTKAITLIALVISILVLLILAGVSTAGLTGQNGLLTRAQAARDKSNAGAIEENQMLENTLKFLNSQGL